MADQLKNTAFIFFQTSTKIISAKKTGLHFYICLEFLTDKKSKEKLK